MKLSRITEQNIEELEPIGRRYQVKVGAFLYVTVSATGHKHYVADWIDRRTRERITKKLGRFKVDIALDEARRQARELRATTYVPPKTEQRRAKKAKAEDTRHDEETKLITAQNRAFQRKALSWPAP